ncbi:MAG: TRAP transporter small permease subunit [Magnetococcales bacterium]|nr:TRAP transporter small permease subunit [Magnetococcales bacterium]
MNKMSSLSTNLDRLADFSGRMVSWLTLAMVLITFLVVVLRYLFSSGSIALQESVTYCHALLFMLAAGYTLKEDEHVRVDIFYRPLGERGKAWINLLGVIFLLWPVCGFIAYISYPYVASSWSIHEGSREAGGIHALWLLKAVILIMPVLVSLQGLSLAVRSLVTLQRQDDGPSL